MFCISMIMQDHIQLDSYKKKILDFWTLLPYPLYSQDLAPNDFHLFFFYSLQNVLNDKNVSQDQVKTFVENFLSSKPVKFHKLPEKWQEVIQNNGKNTRLIEINSLLDY